MSLPASTILFFCDNRVWSSVTQYYLSDYWSYYCNFSFRLWKLLQATVETAVMSWRKERWRLSSPWLVSLIISTSELRTTWNPRSLKISRHCWRRPRRRLVSSGSAEFRSTGEHSDGDCILWSCHRLQLYSLGNRCSMDHFSTAAFSLFHKADP